MIHIDLIKQKGPQLISKSTAALLFVETRKSHLSSTGQAKQPNLSINAPLKC